MKRLLKVPKGSLVNNLDTLRKILMARLFSQRYPLSVTFISTYRCNFSCKYCDIWTYKGEEMTTGQVISMIEQFSEAGMKRFSFNGGEPLLKEDIGELIAYCKEKNVFTTMFTNGSLVKDRVKILKGLDVLVISLDGPPEVHNTQRQRGSYEKVIEAIKAATGEGIRVWTNTVITIDSAGSIDFVLNKAKELKFQTIYQPVFYYSHSSVKREIDRLACSTDAYQKVIELLKLRKREGAPIVHSIEYLDYISNPNWEMNKRKCWAGKLYCAVTPDGRVVPCYPIFNTKIWPSGVELGFEEAFNQLANFSCGGCYCVLVESDFLYALKVKAIFNLIKSLNSV